MLADAPLVSVRITTYNHEKYIGQCLESVLMQKTDFPFEICIGEDESSDQTRKICIQYAEKHPDKIKLFLRSRKDVIYINGYPSGKFNSRETSKACNGKYIALLEGDDFWNSDTKLQQQVDLFRSDPSVIMVHSEVSFQNEITGEFILRLHKFNKMGLYDNSRQTMLDCLVGRIQFNTCSFCLDKSFYFSMQSQFPQLFANEIPNGDNVISTLCLAFGKTAYIAEPLATYRRNAGSMVSFNTEGASKRQLAFAKGRLTSIERLADAVSATASERQYIFDVALPSIFANAVRWQNRELGTRCWQIVVANRLKNRFAYSIIALGTRSELIGFLIRGIWFLRRVLLSLSPSTSVHS